MSTAGDVHVGIHHQSHDETVQLGHGECQIEQLAENLMMEVQTATHAHAMRKVEVIDEQSAPGSVCCCWDSLCEPLKLSSCLYGVRGLHILFQKDLLKLFYGGGS